MIAKPKAPAAGLVLLVVTCVWGSTFVVTQDLLITTPPFFYLSVRFGCAAILLLPLLLFRKGGMRTPGFFRDSLVLGLFNACGLPLQVFGQVYTSPAKSSFITSLNTPLTALVGLIIYRAVPTSSQRIAIGLATLGLVLLTWPPAGTTLNTGDLLTVGCAVLYAFFIVEAARRAPRHDSVALTVAMVVIAATLYLTCYGACHLAIAKLPVGEWPAILHIEARAIPHGPRVAVELAYMAVVCVALVMLAQTWAMQRLSAANAAVIYSLEPVVATTLAVAIHGASEWPGSRGASGGFLVLCAVYVAETRDRRRRNKAAAINNQTGASG